MFMRKIQKKLLIGLLCGASLFGMTACGTTTVGEEVGTPLPEVRLTAVPGEEYKVPESRSTRRQKEKGL